MACWNGTEVTEPDSVPLLPKMKYCDYHAWMADEDAVFPTPKKV